MKKIINYLIYSIFAGIAISIGASVFLSCESRYVGAFFFSVGLITVLFFGFNLYTGRVGYILENKPSYIGYVGLSVIGNALGCLMVGLMLSPIGNVAAICENKLNKTLWSVFADALMCGLLIFISVDIYKKHKNTIGVLLCIPTFILCGFEHSIADMFYFFNARIFTTEMLVFILMVILGNAVGGLLIPASLKLTDYLAKE